MMDKIRPLHEKCCQAWTKYYYMGENVVIAKQTIPAQMRHLSLTIFAYRIARLNNLNVAQTLWNDSRRR